ncbi:Protease inhibitor [Paenibacillus sp. JJ-100]|uniref:copper amine oxidase N-terminal domain-containing protein n=1 Tax=Paenibacillus sp. JJ-100 TaxID=2974896 RepID=UPI0022FF9EF7|nr:copper amine oxidase N-terminal domain-containing protein [Paenibacillus sp. JJ-100]CAI6084060.1 Protease inhibitor [Paenibacillus sp. JJ-100]
MKNNMKKVSTLVALSMALSGGSAYAATMENTISSAQENSALTTSIAAEAIQVSVNGASVAHGYWNQDQKTAMIPLRALTEALGIELKWNKEDKSAELTRGTLWTQVFTGKDRYSVNKMLLTLGIAPEIKDGILYVPAVFAEKVLHAQVNTAGNQVTITSEEDVKTVVERGVITLISNQDTYPSIQIGGAGPDGIVLNLNEDTQFISADGKEISLADLSIGMVVEAEHSLAATLSLPPQTPTYKVTVLDTAAEIAAQPAESFGTAGSIENVDTKDGIVTQIEITGTRLTETAPDHVVLNIDKATSLVNPKGEVIQAEQLTKGTKVIGFYSPALTRSLPPIGTAWKVVVELPEV